MKRAMYLNLHLEQFHFLQSIGVFLLLFMIVTRLGLFEYEVVQWLTIFASIFHRPIYSCLCSSFRQT